MGIYYKAISKSVANINFFNFTPYYSKIDYPKTGSIPLLKSNFLVDNGVYYASQTINGIRSTDRLAVKVVINSLGVSDYFFKKYSEYIKYDTSDFAMTACVTVTITEI